MHVLIAPNAFKNSLSAEDAALAISEGFLESKLVCTTKCFPIADGGDGTATLLVKYLAGEWIKTKVRDPLGRNIESSFGWVEKSKTAIIELAAASGLRLLDPGEYDPLNANTAGTGDLLLKTLDHAPNQIIICIGGSATVDAGSGLLKTLGVKFFDEAGCGLTTFPSQLSQISTIDLAGIDSRIHGTAIRVFCDVDNKLLGSSGAAAIYSPQKGASEKDVMILEKMLSHFNNVTQETTGIDMSSLKYGGAAGGIAAALHTFLNANLEKGIYSFLDMTDFENELLCADLVITGEGTIDLQTLEGKGPFGVAERAKSKSIPVFGLAGKIPHTAEQKLSDHFDRLYSINEDVTDLMTAMTNTFTNLKATATKIGNELFFSNVQN